MRDGLLYILAGVKAKHAMEGPGVWRDAKMLEKAMKGLGTKDTQLVYRWVSFAFLHSTLFASGACEWC